MGGTWCGWGWSGRGMVEGCFEVELCVAELDNVVMGKRVRRRRKNGVERRLWRRRQGDCVFWLYFMSYLKTGVSPAQFKEARHPNAMT